MQSVIDIREVVEGQSYVAVLRGSNTPIDFVREGKVMGLFSVFRIGDDGNVRNVVHVG